MNKVDGYLEQGRSTSTSVTGGKQTGGKTRNLNKLLPEYPKFI